MYFNICASKNKITVHVQLFFFFARALSATKILKFSPCGALAEKKKHKIYVFQCASHKKLRCAYTAWKKIQKKNSWTLLNVTNLKYFMMIMLQIILFSCVYLFKKKFEVAKKKYILRIF